VFFSERALEKLLSRKTVPATYNLDLNLVSVLIAAQLVTLSHYDYY
jgi:hypothetical protein